MRGEGNGALVSAEEYFEWTLTFAVVALSYCFLFVLAVHSFLEEYEKHQNPIGGVKPGGWSWQRAFHGLLAFGSMIRILYNGLGALLVWKDILIPFQIVYILNTLPSFVFISTYLILLFFWAEIYHAGRSECSSTSILRFRPLFIVVNCVMYVMMFILYYFDLSSMPWKYSTPMGDNFMQYEICGIYFGAIVYLSVALSYLVYGGLIYMRLEKIRAESIVRTKLIKKVKFITLLLSFCFIARSLVTLLSSRKNYAFIETWWFYLIYWLLTEIACLVLMFHILAEDIPTEYSPFTSENTVHSIDEAGSSSPLIQHNPLPVHPLGHGPYRTGSLYKLFKPQSSRSEEARGPIPFSHEPIRSSKSLSSIHNNPIPSSPSSSRTNSLSQKGPLVLTGSRSSNSSPNGRRSLLKATLSRGTSLESHSAQ
eukprot:Nk52_evm2s269 gene=Nk52_evmTU2s269